MLEFYYTFNEKEFHKKSRLLAEELRRALEEENIDLLKTAESNIDEEYKKKLDEELFDNLNNLYFTIRKAGKGNSFLRKYLPEFKVLSQSSHLFADFFSGAGGLSQGLVDAGFKPAFVNDTSVSALETYYFNHDLPVDRFFCGDIKDIIINFSKYEEIFTGIKVIAGGPPCQGFSTANRQNFEIEAGTYEKRFIEDERNVLYKQFVKLLGLIKPDFFIMENVKGMMRVEKQIEEDIQNETDQKYSFIPLDVDAQNFDIPQSRRRYILVGGRNFMFIEKIKENVMSKKRQTSKYKLADALFGLPAIKTNPYKMKLDYESSINGFAFRKFETEENDFIKELNGYRKICNLFNHKSRYNNENDLKIFSTLPEGENSLHESIQHLSNYTNRNHIFKDKYYKLKQNEVCKTITSHMKYDCHMYIHPTQSRGLSPREAARIQTFPDDYVFRGTLNEWYSQIGNAVPVKLAKVIANEIIGFYK